MKGKIKDTITVTLKKVDANKKDAIICERFFHIFSNDGISLNMDDYDNIRDILEARINLGRNSDEVMYQTKLIIHTSWTVVEYDINVYDKEKRKNLYRINVKDDMQLVRKYLMKAVDHLPEDNPIKSPLTISEVY